MDELERDALLTLIACGGRVLPRRELLEACGSAAAALDAGPTRWRASGWTPLQIERALRPDAAALARSRAWLDRPDRTLLGWHDADYPALLARAPHPPLALFVAGDPMHLWQPILAVVGSRNATPAGRTNAAQFSRALVASGLGVGSGLAAGIDTAAHEAALEAGGLTVAVLGTGPDIAYPASNRSLHARIAEHGALVSEHAPGTGPHKTHFPSRNRILAGLSLGTLVVEAAERSGALITARLAAEAGREVFAVPGSIHNPLARGCHRLIRDGAALVESEPEIRAALAALMGELGSCLRSRLAASIVAADTTQAPAVTGERAVDTEQERLWQALGHDPIGMDALVQRTGLTPADLSAMLLHMELDGRIASQHGHYYRNR